MNSVYLVWMKISAGQSAWKWLDINIIDLKRFISFRVTLILITVVVIKVFCIIFIFWSLICAGAQLAQICALQIVLQTISPFLARNMSQRSSLTLVLGKADPDTFFQCKKIEEGNAIIEDGKRQVFFLNIKKDNRFFLFPFFLNIKTTAVSLQQRKKTSRCSISNSSI